MFKPYNINPGQKCNLEKFDCLINSPGIEKADALVRISENAATMAKLARRLYAENSRAILLVLQGMDAAGKDGSIRAVMRGVNPRSCQVYSFKKPSEIELDHDYLWRVHHVMPRKGNIGIFNRSHYEDVLVVRVHQLVPEKEWRMRYEQINNFEKMLVDNGTTILKCYLHISFEEQRKRLQARLNDPEAHWKFNPQDLQERKRWTDYRAAYNEAITQCNTDHAPWHIVPADRKWYRNLVISELLRGTMESLDPQIPPAVDDYSGWIVE